MDEIIREQEKIISKKLLYKVPIIHQDNTSTNSLITKEKGNSRAKYMKARQAIVKETHGGKDFEIAYIKIRKMIANI